MFEDLLGEYESKDLRPQVIEGGSPDQVCPTCGSFDVESIYGVFSNVNTYFSTMFCSACNSNWVIEYDTNLNIVNVELRR
jgi:transposase-like protein